jgi:hypothetical protein
MAGMGGERRVFSEQEVGEIVQRAAELQERSGQWALSYSPGVTREQLERVAREVGVEPAFLQQAIEERGRERRASVFLPAQERVVEGELDPNDFDLILEQVRSVRTRHHPPTQVGRMLQARVWTGSGLANLEVISRNQRTRVRVKARPIVEFFGTFYPAFFVSLFGGAALGAAGHPGVSAALAAGSLTAAAAGFRFWTHRSQRAAGKIADQLEGVLQQQLAPQRQPAEEQTTDDNAAAARTAAARKSQDVGR